jgi:C1A family cysteine protease
MYRLDDFKFSELDDRDYTLSVPMNMPLPSKFRLDIRGGVRDQGDTGSCSAQVAALLKEYHEFKERGIRSCFSVDYIYSQRMNKDSEGMTPRNTFKLLTYDGALPSRYWKRKYNRKTIPEDVITLAKNFRIDGFARADTAAALKEAIYLHGVGYLALPVYTTLSDYFWRNPADHNMIMGGHAIAAIGWTEEGIILRNSWGSSWGDRGEIILPYDDWEIVVEAWVAIDAITADIFKRNGKLRRQ